MRAVAIDGPAGSGKSTLARHLATALGFLYVDTGAMYRAIALQAERQGVDLDDPEVMGEVARQARISFSADGSNILLDDEDVSKIVRSPQVTRNSRYAARAPAVRAELVRRQREFARVGATVMEGRDITTVVLPEARWKFFIHADPAERARRRYLEMTAAGHNPAYADILAAIIERDAADHQVGPLKEAEEIARSGSGLIHLLDTTRMSIEEAVRQATSVILASDDSS